jgi:Tfp pilus assembly protein PilO
VTQSRILLAVVAAVAASAAFFFMVLSPKRDEIAKLDADIAAKQTELTTNQQLVADYQTAKGSYRTAYASVVRLGKAVPVEDDVRSLVVQLDGAARKAGVNFQSISVGGGSGGGAAPAPAAGAGAGATTGAAQLPPGATVGPAGFPVMPFTFTFDGSFFKLSDFFRRLEDFVSVRNQNVSVTGRLLTLDSLSLQPTNFPSITASVSATTYLVSPMQGLTGGATAQGPGTASPTTQAAATASAASAATTTATSTGAVG